MLLDGWRRPEVGGGEVYKMKEYEEEGMEGRAVRRTMTPMFVHDT